MPPKKKDGAKKSETPSPTQVLSVEDKTNYLKIISELENRISKYQDLCDHLTVTNGKYERELTQQISEKKDITEYLKMNLQGKGLEIYEVNTKLSALKEEKEKERQAFEGQLRQLRQEFQETKDALSVENITLAGKLASLEDFKIQKEEILDKMSKLENDIQENESKRKEELYQLEKQSILDRHTLQKCTLQKLIDISNKFREETNRQMAETTIRSIQENTALSNDYKKLKKKCAAVLEENKKLKEKESAQKINESILQSMKTDLAERNSSLLSIINLLTAANRVLKKKVVDLEKQIKDSEKLKDDLFATKINIKYRMSEMKQMNSDHATITKDLENLTLQDKQTGQFIQKAHSAFLQVSTFCEKVYEFLNMQYNSEEYQIAKEELSHLLLSLLSFMYSMGVFDSQTEELYKQLQSLPTKEETEELTQHQIEKNFHYKIGDAGMVPPKDRLLTKSIQKQKSQLLGNNRIYTKYLVNKIAENKKETCISEEISTETNV